MSSIKTGQKAEAIAADFLKQQGLQIVQKNYRCPLGEIDIICKNSQSVIFTEVRYRRTKLFGGPLESITFTKQNRLERAANHFLKYYSWTKTYFSRFDVIAISPKSVKIIDIDFQNVEIDWIQNAFSSR